MNVEVAAPSEPPRGKHGPDSNRGQAPESRRGAGPVLSGEAMFDIGGLFRIIRRRIWVLIGVVGLVSAAAVTWSYSQTPLYTAETRVLFGGRQENVVDLEAVLSGLTGSAIQTEREIIESRALGQRVVEKLNLDRDPEFNPRLDNAPPSLLSRVNPLPLVRRYILAPAGLDGTMADTPDASPPPDSLDAERQLQLGVVNRYLGRLETEQVPSTTVLAIRFTSTDASKAALIANTVADLYLLSQLDAKFEATRRASDWLTDRLADLREEVRIAESAVADYRARQGLVEAAGTNALESQVADLNGRVVSLRAELAEKQQRLARVRQLAASGGNLQTLADIAGSGALADLRGQRIALDRREAELRSRYQERHPEIVNVLAEQRELQRAVDTEIKRVIASLEHDVALAASREQSTRQSRDEVQRSLDQQFGSQVQLRELERNAESTRTLFENFLSRFKETQQQEGLTQPDVQILSTAVVPGGPSYPNHQVNIAAGLVIAAMLGLVAVFLVEKLDSGVRTTQELESLLHIPALGMIPVIRRSGRRNATLRPEDVVVDQPLSMFAEGVRSLRTAVAMSDIDRIPKVVLITSSLPSEGKTTLSACLARSAAVAGKRTLLIDCDMRRPRIHEVFGQRPTAGLVELLMQEASLEDVVARDEKSGLDFIAIVRGAHNPSDVLGSRSMQDLLYKLSQIYDLILLDSPPSMAVADSRVLATVADTTLFLVRWERTNKAAAEAGLRALRELGGRVAGVALNGVDMRRQRKYAYGEYSYYYHRYRDYYTS